MRQTKAYTHFLATFIILFAKLATTASQCSVSKHFYDHSKIMQVNDHLQYNYKTSPKNPMNTEDNNFNITTASVNYATAKKWQVGRVSRKQYEIVNMLWRKNNIFFDVEHTSQTNLPFNATKKNNISRPSMPVNRNGPPRYKFVIPRPVLQPTPSYIEFYYLDDLDEPVQQNEANNVTTVYDKIKFFEMYDTRTSLNIIDRESLYKDDRDNSARENDIRGDEKILLEHVDQDIRHQDDVPHKMKYAKKHIGGLEKKAEEVRASYEKTSTSSEICNVTINQTNYSSNSNMTDTKSSLKPQYIFDKNLNPEVFKNMSRHPHWSEYSFAAVYVYDRSQIHCDAAAISPHWLIASASCLSRHRDDPEGDRSAFVTYCGDSWWNPERITYVKYSHVHPRYHPRDRIRRRLFNIGVIQVVSSMASACANWAPISIMSHHFAADGEGVIASAVGWGLDRYNTNYASSDLPRRPLAVFEGMVYSDSCPGNSDYRKAKQSNEEGISNVYCLTLPPYSGEENDTIHGGLLLVGGKLVALYLQEERRQWGDQSAQYTGVWRLFPWVHDMAREPEGNDFFLQ